MHKAAPLATGVFPSWFSTRLHHSCFSTSLTDCSKPGRLPAIPLLFPPNGSAGRFGIINRRYSPSQRRKQTKLMIITLARRLHAFHSFLQMARSVLRLAIILHWLRGFLVGTASCFTRFFHSNFLSAPQAFFACALPIDHNSTCRRPEALPRLSFF